MIEGLGGLRGLGDLGSSPPLRAPEGVRRGGASGEAWGSAATNFAAALEEAASRAINTVQTAEAVSMKAMLGEADIQQVVNSVMAAERTLSTALAIRNKLIAAWQEISRMQI